MGKCAKGHRWSWWSWRLMQVPGGNGTFGIRAWWRMCTRCRLAFESDAGRLAPQRWNVLALHALSPKAPEVVASAPKESAQ